MRKIRLMIVISALLASACESQNQRSASYAEKCKELELKGFLNIAEDMCASAWFDVESDSLTPTIQSQRLYDLGRIMRQRQKYVEAEPLLLQSMEIEETVSGSTSTAYGQRLMELSLVKAGQSNWVEGTVFLEPLMEIADQFSKQDQIAVANILKHYAAKLSNTDRASLAKQFESKAAMLFNAVKNAPNQS